MKPAVLLPVSATMTILAGLAVTTGIVWGDTTNFPPAISPGPNTLWLLNHTNINPFRLTPNEPRRLALAPGVYESSPFACEIKIPEPTGDNCIIQGNLQPKIEIEHPEIHLTPKITEFNLTIPKSQTTN
jgi:hypothetical protein